jgi:DNA-binding XRE family transcriptional regulator
MNKYNPVSMDFATFKKLSLADKEAQQAYDDLEEEFLLIAEMLRARKRAKKNQKDVANLMKTTSSAISRLESLGGQKKHAPTLETLRKYAAAVGCYLSIKFIPKRKKKARS